MSLALSDTSISRSRVPTLLHQTGAYAIVADIRERLLTVIPGNGRVYLPGGRVEAGEAPREALLREIAEECGWSATVMARVTDVRQTIMDGTVDLYASFWRARLLKRLGSRPEHVTTWLTPAEALLKLHREGDRRAVQLAFAARING